MTLDPLDTRFKIRFLITWRQYVLPRRRIFGWPGLTLSPPILRLTEGLDELVERNNVIGRDWKIERDHETTNAREGRILSEQRDKEVALEGYAIRSTGASVFSMTVIIQQPDVDVRLSILRRLNCGSQRNVSIAGSNLEKIFMDESWMRRESGGLVISVVCSQWQVITTKKFRRTTRVSVSLRHLGAKSVKRRLEMETGWRVHNGRQGYVGALRIPIQAQPRRIEKLEKDTVCPVSRCPRLAAHPREKQEAFVQKRDGIT
ncbi:unnamed protein product, partial [Heterotrigona itama]